jgi:flagellar biosynthesis/type III secretory pathway protein FliH
MSKKGAVARILLAAADAKHDANDQKERDRARLGRGIDGPDRSSYQEGFFLGEAHGYERAAKIVEEELAD